MPKRPVSSWFCFWFSTNCFILPHSYQRIIPQPELVNEIGKLELFPVFSKTQAAVEHCNLARRPL